MLLALALALPCAGDPVPIELETTGAAFLIGTLHTPDVPPDGPTPDPATVVVVADVGDVHVRLESLVNPVVGRGMNLVVLDATRKDLSPVLAWLAARGADTSRLGFVGFGEGCEAVAATRAAQCDTKARLDPTTKNVFPPNAARPFGVLTNPALPPPPGHSTRPPRAHAHAPRHAGTRAHKRPQAGRDANANSRTLPGTRAHTRARRPGERPRTTTHGPQAWAAPWEPK